MFLANNRKQSRPESQPAPRAEPTGNPIAGRLEVVHSKKLHNYKVDWDRFNPQILEMLANGCRDVSLIQDIVNDVIAELHIITNFESVGSAFLKSLAADMLKQYPDTFEDRFDDGSPMVQNGPSCKLLLKKLVWRNSNQRRKKKQKFTF